MLHLDPPRPTAEVVNGAAELNPGFSITENKQHACVFRLVFQYVHSASGEVVRTHRRGISNQEQVQLGDCLSATLARVLRTPVEYSFA